MTKKNLINFLLIASYIAATCIIGCIPEDSLQWSADGSIGIYSKDGALFLVDGKTGSLTQIAPKETTTNWPAISSDGRFFAYGQKIIVENFADALNLLTPGQIKMLQIHSVAVKENIQKKVDEESMFKTEVLGEGLFADDVLKSYNEEYRNWVVHYLFEKLDDDGTIAKRLGIETVKKALEKSVNYYRLILTPSDDLNKKTVVVTSVQNIWKISFSSNGKFLAYVTDRINGDTFEVGFDLYVASPSENISAALVEQAVAIGYDFRPDGRAIAYMKPEVEDFDEDKFALGSLVERTIIDPNGRVIASPVNPDNNENTSLATHTCTGPAKELAGVGYYSWMYILYARDNRIFFTSAKMSLPSSKLDEEKVTVFCCDTLTGAISEILPQIALDFTEGNCYLFTLSHDSQKILLPGNKNTLGIYALGQDLDSSKILIDKNESFGDDAPPKLVSQWKGCDQISCLVAKNSHYICPDPNTPARRKEIVILDAKGKLQKVLSKDWSDELLDY
jgi:hypothetical protein